MSKSSPSRQSSSKARLRAAIEGLESRAYLNGVVFGTPNNTSVSGLVYTDLVDLNGDGKADLVTANTAGTTGSVSVLLGDGNGGFGAAQTVNLPFTPLTIRTGVLGTNGKTDIVVGSTNSNQFAVLLQDSSGNFTSTTYATGLSDTQSVAIGDFNGDGVPDVALASFDPGTSNNLAVYLNNGSGGFAVHQVVSVPHSQVASITAFRAGARQDLAVADATSNAVTVLQNDGSGHFVVGLDYAVGAEPVTIADGQFNLNSGDGTATNDDLVTADAQGGSVSVLIGNNDGSFQSTVRTTSLSSVAPAPGGPLKVRVSNVNSDGLPDLICLLSSGSSGDAAVLLGNGDGTFHIGTVIPSSQSGRNAIAAGDLNGDGLTDMVLGSANTVTALVNVTNQDHTPPTASVASTTSSSVGATTIQFVVNYSDNTQIDTTTLNSANVTVTDPNGNAQPVTLVSSNLPNGPTVSATYSIPAPSGSLGAGDNGSYTVTATSNTANAVKDANGNPVAGGSLGTFTVAVVTNGPNLVAGAVNVRNPAAAVAGTRFVGATSVVVLNSGTQAAKGRIVIELFASPTQSIPAGAAPLVSVTRNVNLLPGRKVVLATPGFTWPATLVGNEFIVADVNATQSIPETNYADNIGISARATAVALPFVDVNNLWTGRIPATLKAGRRVLLPVLLQNLGNVAARGTATFSVQAVNSSNAANTTTVGTGSVRLAIPAHGRQTVSLPLTVPTSLASGTYTLAVTVSFPGDTNATNDTVTSTATFTV